MQEALNIIIVAADPLVRSGLATLLNDLDDSSVFTFTSPTLFLSSYSEDEQIAKVNLALWDLGWESGSIDGISFQEYDFPIAALVAGPDQALEAWQAGAKAILARDSDPDDIATALKAVAQGLTVLDPNAAGALLPVRLRYANDLERPPTPREIEVLQLLAEGLTNRAIARHLEISEHTVKFHVNAILSKLDAQSRTEAVVTATRLGYIAL